MLVRKFSIAVAVAAVMTAAIALAQKPAAPAPAATPQAAAVPDGGAPHFIRPETTEQRQTRLGTAEDPGPDPNPSQHFWRFGKSYHISKFERRLASYETQDANYVRPLAMVNFAYEVYQQNDKYVWCWMPDIDETQVAQDATAKLAQTSRYKDEDLAYFARIRPQFTALTPAESRKRITFTESSDGLPQEGSYRNSLAVADMNGDGFLDLIAPPERKGNGEPQIFLGDGKGHWHLWKDVTWPHTVDYGGVTAADLNKDGKMDLVFAVHLNGLYVFLGDGKGHFKEATVGLPHDYPTRRAVVADVDGDGYPDIIASSEGPSAAESDSSVYGRVRVFLNRKKAMSWEAINVIDPSIRVGGDWLSVGNFNGDKYPDFISSSIYFNGTQIVQLSDGPKKWKIVPTDGDLIPAWSYFLASTVGRFTKGTKNDEAIIAYTRFWPGDLDSRIVATPPVVELTNIDRLVFTPQGMKRFPIMRWNGHVGVRGVASGDFDGDGNLDLIVTREDADQREVLLLLGDGKGNFTRAAIEGLPLEDNNIYDIKVADVNGDGRPDVILMYELLEKRREDFRRMAVGTQSGSIKVFLNRGAKSVPADMKAAK